MRHRLLALFACALLGTAVIATTAAAAPLPVLYNGLVGYAHASPAASPPGANDWSCKPSPAGDPRTRHVHRHVGQLAGALPALAQQRLLRVRAQLRVSYTAIESANDEVVTPYTSAFLTGASVNSILLQSQCPLDQGEHLSMPYDHIADADVLNALDPTHPVTPACTPVLPVVGG